MTDRRKFGVGCGSGFLGQVSALILALLLVLTGTGESEAQVSFADINPDQSTRDPMDPDSASGGRVNGVALTPGNNDIGYAASEWGGLYKTLDRGRTWDFLPGHVPNITYRIAVDPSNVNRVFATSWYDGRIDSRAGINVSPDAGNSWSHAGLAPADFCPQNQRTQPSAFGISIAPDDPNDIHVGTNCGLAVSQDSGATWTWIDPTPQDPPSRVWDVVVHHGGIIDVCGDDGHLRSIDDGATWSSGIGLPSGACSIAASPHERNVIFVTVGANIYESSDGGATWTQLGTPDSRRQGRIPFVLTMPTSSTTFFLWFGDVRLFRGFCVSTPDSPTRCPMATVGPIPAPPPPTPPGWAGPFTRLVGGHDDVGYLAFDTTTPVNACPLLFSSDGGVYFNTQTNHPSCQSPLWEQPDRTPHAMWHWSFGASTDDASGETVLMTASQDVGTHGTVDAAAALPIWAARDCCDAFDAEMEQSQVLYTFCCASAANRSTRLMLRNADLTGGGQLPPNSYPESGLVPGFRFPDIIDRFAPNSYVLITGDCTPGVNGCPPGSSGDGGVFITNDITANPISWTELGNATEPDSTNTCAVKAAAGPSGTTVFYVQNVSCSGNTTTGQLWRFDFSGNPGAAWTRIDTNLPSGGVGIFDVDPTNANRLFVSNIRADSLQMMRSEDGGMTWTPDMGLDQVMTGNGVFVYRPSQLKRSSVGFGTIAQPTLIQFDPTDPSIIVAGAETSGLFLSTDNGITWQVISDPLTPEVSGLPHLPGPRKAHFQRISDSQRLIYVSTRGRGLWRVSLQLPRHRFSYSAKIVCGTQPDPDNLRLVRGVYGTAINIINPLFPSVRLNKRLSLTFPPDEQAPGEVYMIADHFLGRYQALEVDCEDVRHRIFPNGFPLGYIKGFVTIESTESLTVTGVYSTRSIEEEKHCCKGGSSGEHSSIDVEQIFERRIAQVELPDLIPLPGLPTNGTEGFPGVFYCVRNPQGGTPTTIRVRVLNQGAGLAGASVTRVEFEDAGVANANTMPLGPGQDQFHDFQIPNGCFEGFSSRCQFRITVDAPAPLVAESNEGNNVVESFCLAPAG